MLPLPASMDLGRESSCQGHPVQVFYHITPASPNFSDPKVKCENGSENQFNNDTIGKLLLMDNVWNSIPCSDLLALADAAITTKGSDGGCGAIGGGVCGCIGSLGGGDGGELELNMRFEDHDGTNFMPDSQQYEQPDRVKYLFDLNSPPTVTEPPPESVTNFSTQFTPATPKRTRKVVRKRVVSDIINSNTDENPNQVAINLEQSLDDIWQLDLNEDFEEGSSDDLSLQKTPTAKPKRRKHRPKVVIEGQPKTVKKSTTPKPSTGKRKYTRKIILEKTTPEGANEEIESTRQTRNSCRRKINFEEEQMYDKPLGPITPNKSETKTGIKNTCSRAERGINFSRYDNDNDAGFVWSRNASTCSTSALFKDAFGICYDSLEEYLSTITNFPKKKRSKMSGNSIMSSVSGVNNQHSCKQMVTFGHVECFRKKRSKILKRVRDLSSYVGIIERERYSCMEALAADVSAIIATKKRTKRSFILPSSSYYNYYFLTNHIGFSSSLRRKSTYDIKALVNQFEYLGIDDRKVEENRHALVPYLTRYREKNGIVLYQKDRSLVPFEDFYDEMKIRKPRPKVDLDDETSRVWRLLLEDINSQGIDGTDEENTKWWEEERNVFSGRATSFIARMHLVQGDRRFSCWKGSVVDSVIGVFLTQNVSDHLSSSAFMNLAARYPLKSKNSNESFHEDKLSVYIEESCQLDLEETITWHENNSNHQLTQDHDSMTLHDADSYEEKEVASSNESSRINNSFASTMTNEVNSQDQPNESKSQDMEYIDLREEKTIMHKKDEEKCASEQSEISAESAIPDTVEIVNTKIYECQMVSENSEVIESNENDNFQKSESGIDEGSMQVKKGKTRKAKKIKVDWDSLRKSAQVKKKRERTPNTMDSVDYDAVRCADVNEIAETIKDRGMNNMLAERIKNFLNRLVKDHGSIDLEWLRDVPPDKAKEYLLSFRGLGLKSVECVRLLTLHHLAFPVDTNVGRIAVRLGWVPLQPLPESLQLHLLELYPVLESIQKYLWPRLCKLDQRTLYELHYQMITFGKVFCTKNKPNCNACPMRGECRHFASAFASARLALPAPEEKDDKKHGQNPRLTTNEHQLTLPPTNYYLQQNFETQNHEPVIEEPSTPEPEKIQQDFDIEDFCEENEEIPIIRLNMEAFTQNLQNYMENNMELAEGDMSRALVALTSEAASIPTRKLKNVSQLRTEHHVYELPDSHPLLEGLDKREPDDPCSYLLAIWTPGETAESIQPPKGECSSQESGTLCHKETCFLCNSIREANSQTVRGTLLIPCRTAMRGSFPLNGTYFQVNEVFADHDSSLNPIDVPRSWLWNLPRRTVYFGTSIPTIFRGLTTEDIQYCFWRGFVCVRGFDQKTRAPRPLMARLHFPASKLKRSRWKNDEN